ncbi:sensor histidine kinase [Streptomyces shenzhenensis]|uniref:sensor histidine kinase n=1 Tax=Streptomyces shenzhenensis TaxID=943815 RepID=UPI001F3BA83B|nr:HAMP domain-containing sensor histidine kinase [Streptomyces shenzhenensis]
MRRRLVLLVVATSSLVLVAFLLPLGLLVRTVAADRAIDGAVTRAQSLTPLVATLERTRLAQVVRQLDTETPDSPMTVFLADGGTVGAPAPRSQAMRLAASGRSIVAQAPGGVEVLVAVQGLPDGTAVIRVFAPESELRHGLDAAWMLLGAVGAGLLVLSILVADRLARSLVRPLSDLARASDRLGTGDLTARATPAGPPEVRKVTTALNALAGRIGELLTRERESVADLSHRLRTPLTALRIEAESLTDPEESRAIGEGLDTLERTVSDIIREARRPSHGGLWAVCDAVAVVRERADFWSVLADEQRRPMSVRIPEGPIPVLVSAEDLAACVDVLLDNVFAHTPDGVGFGIGLSPRPGGGARLTVRDAGPGFIGGLPTERGASQAGSTGLGLDIARRTAKTAAGTLELDNGPTGGAWITLELGAPPGAQPRRHRRHGRLPHAGTGSR